MNIFWLDKDAYLSAQYHCDRHVTKMIVEYAQLLSTAHFVLDGVQVGYKPTHINHPCAKWVREDQFHYNEVWRLYTELLEEYRRRYSRIHATSRLIGELAHFPKNLPLDSANWAPPPQCVPDDCKRLDPVEAYRAYYMTHKRHIAKWKNGAPDWFK